jgi:uncharacterized membrane protein
MLNGRRISTLKLLQQPEYLFCVLALLFGVVYAVLVPAFLGNDEGRHFRRAISISHGGFLMEPVQVAGGIINALNVFEAFERAHLESSSDPSASISTQTYLTNVSAIALDPAVEKELNPNFLAVYSPITYVVQSASMRIGLLVNATPMELLNIARLSGMVAAIFLTALAIRIMPSHRYLLCALALLPAMVYTRSTLNADQLTNAVAFLFIALVLRESLKTDRLPRQTLFSLAFLAFVLAQMKSGYVLLPLFAFAIPGIRFSSVKQRLLAIAFIVIPGITAMLAWLLYVKFMYFTDTASYQTGSGLAIPGDQLRFILNNPLDYIAIVARTLFLTDFAFKHLREMISSLTIAVPAPLPVFAVMAALMGLLLLSAQENSQKASYSLLSKLLGAGIFSGTLLFNLTLLYVHWTAYQEPLIHGFQGRYLFPVLPLLLLFAPQRQRALVALSPAKLVVSLSAMGFFAGYLTLMGWRDGV